MKISKLSLAALGLLALSACAQPPAPPAYVEVPWKGQIVPPTKFAPVSYSIPFRSGSVHLSKTDHATLRAAAEAFKSGADKVTVVGHTDTVGNAKANQHLSDRRATLVTKSLVRLGVPAGAITTSGVGESQLVVQTADKVAEKGNRRVVIDIR
jgi:outer membrane protein OmpA-like peptidoglycan-associated protein